MGRSVRPSVLLVDGDIPVYRTSFACADEKLVSKVHHTAKRVLEHIWALSGCTQYLGFITDSSKNFRIQRATTWPYKGTRETDEVRERPLWYDEIRRFYMDTFGFQMMRGV